MAAALRALCVAALVGAVLAADHQQDRDGQPPADGTAGCTTQAWGQTTGLAVPMVPAILRRTVYDNDVLINNPCALGGGVGIIVTVCDPDATPLVTIRSLNMVHVRRFLPLHDAIVEGKIFCTLVE